MRFLRPVIIFALLICPLFSAAPKIFDCFMFYNELDILEIRLNEMYDYVDHFVLVESTETHRGTAKPLIFDENKSRFNRFLDKIIHIIVTDRIQTNNLWVRENFQRNQILRGLKGSSYEDIVIISDVDEIIRGQDLPKIIALYQAKQQKYIACQLDHFFYYLNGFAGQWGGPVVTNAYDAFVYSPQHARNLRNQVFRIPNVGWHFSSASGLEATLAKSYACVHGAEHAAALGHEADRQAIEAARAARDCIPLDSLFPQYVIDHREEYTQKGLIKEECKITREMIGQHYWD